MTVTSGALDSEGEEPLEDSQHLAHHYGARHHLLPSPHSVSEILLHPRFPEWAQVWPVGAWKP